MRRIQKVAYALGGFVLGVLFTSAVWLWVESQPDFFSPLQSENPKGRLPRAKNPTKLCI